MPAKSFGVDWSNWQPPGIDHARRLKEEGGSFAFAKVSQDFASGFGFPEHLHNLKSVGGIVPGAYHFLIEPGAGASAGYNRGRGATSAADQAVTFVNAVKRANGGTLDGVMMALDLEALNDTSVDGTSRNIRSRPSAADAQAFAKRFHELAPRHPLFLYTTYSYIRSTDLSKWSQPMALWLAYWSMSGTNDLSSKKTGIPESRWTTKYGGITPTVIQYQSGGHGGRAGGYDSDLDASDLEYAELRQYAYPMGELPPDDGEPPTPPGGGDPFDEWWYNVPGAKEAVVTTAAGGGILGLGAGILVVGGIAGLWFLARKSDGSVLDDEED